MMQLVKIDVIHLDFQEECNTLHHWTALRSTTHYHLKAIHAMMLGYWMQQSLLKQSLAHH
jgi:hypothetical protein